VPLLGITGGIATGKSSFTRTLQPLLPAEVFDSDRCARELLASDPAIREQVEEALGRETFHPDGTPDRLKLRELVFSDEEKRRALEAILHPAIRGRWMAWAVSTAGDRSWKLVDIPLLFETGVASRFDCVVVVACSPETQRARLKEQRGLTGDLAEKILAAQLDLSTKIQKADHLIWNDSTLSCLDGQAELLAGALRQLPR